ncbi:hypothetical protein OAN95_06320 [Alphaproteobacteria bacterium]|nr:hypothetical protein [Alphaproteobacteria bacterium]
MIKPLIIIILVSISLAASATSSISDTCEQYKGVKKDACLEMLSKTVDNGKSMSASALLGLIKFESEHELSGFHLYRRGLIEGVQASNAALKHHGKTPLYCAPDEFKLGLRANEIVKNAIAMNTELGSEPYQFILLMELIRTYECE